jgi:hypothetical protein
MPKYSFVTINIDWYDFNFDGFFGKRYVGKEQYDDKLGNNI